MSALSGQARRQRQDRVNEAMGQVVVERLGALGYTPEDGAEILGVGLQTYQRRVTGKLSFYLYELIALSEHVNQPLADWFRDAETMVRADGKQEAVSL